MVSIRPRRVPYLWHPLWWLPAAVVLAVAWANCTMPQERDLCPAGTDGAQFKCWLEEHPDGH